MHISTIQKERLQDAVIISGAPRSGTTLLGKIVSTFAGLEYHFEPPTFYMICASYVMGRLTLDAASDLLRVYCIEDLLIESVHGRGVNLRPNDDSLILDRLNWKDLHQRWQAVGNRADALAWIQKYRMRLAVKMPNVMDALTLIHHAMPNAHLVLMVRDGRHVVHSIVQKGWVTDDGLRNNLWPYHSGSISVPVPYWVPSAWQSAWLSLTVESRACLMWMVHAERALAGYRSDKYFPESKRTLVRYESLLNGPQETASWLADRLVAPMTVFTQRWLEQVKRPASMDQLSDSSLFDRVDAAILKEFYRVNANWGY